MKACIIKSVVCAIGVMSSGYVLAAGGGGVVADPGALEGKHFDAKG